MQAFLTIGLTLSLSLGCIGTNRATLDETAALFHDDLRWGRIPTAEGAVDARARAAFQRHHRGWGSRLRVVDLDVEAVRLGSDTGSLRLRVTWISGQDSTEVRESLIEERWESIGGNWRLVNEAVVAGDPGLFPEAPPAASSGGERATPAPPGADTPATPAPSSAGENAAPAPATSANR